MDDKASEIFRPAPLDLLDDSKRYMNNKEKKLKGILKINFICCRFTRIMFDINIQNKYPINL